MSKQQNQAGCRQRSSNNELFARRVLTPVIFALRAAKIDQPDRMPHKCHSYIYVIKTQKKYIWTVHRQRSHEPTSFKISLPAKRKAEAESDVWRHVEVKQKPEGYKSCEDN